MIATGAQAVADEAARFARSLTLRPDRATLVTLSGELGAGKTTFVQGVAKALGIDERVTSPTFVIMKIYPTEHPPAGGFERLVHIDAYRLKGEHHLQVLGWEELLKDPKNLILMEWPEQAGGAVPTDAVRIEFRYSGDHEREIVYQTETARPA